MRLLQETEATIYTVTLKRWARSCMIEDIHPSFACGTQEVYLWPVDVTFDTFRPGMSKAAMIAVDYATQLRLENVRAYQRLISIHKNPDSPIYASEPTEKS